MDNRGQSVLMLDDTSELLPERGAEAEGGFTLIEVMIAMLLLLIGIAGVLSLQLISMQSTA
jgi:prepilin-type N-terminal cleavage/methylation domain-containing protein